uniref:Cytochrome b-c1 complex subunit Rieske, mitochondrial n=1 Tax=Pyramimonas obovata TaxID=1411642 RepID=A0A7S0RXJ2_9CHLO|eukprot:CAMPEP_0118929970 /NCGR_PEP_ID=MMETSP1169-20130426/6814_1 /TAXON_ID=36882 /ORGANISM="Pyramimonas obovata, Strain CCMP722" /LENGTH=265 /DNA_ID=CAMNT_0006872257 /DNA_START=33 /DNA_END=830 /DNA_ORIENTATION=+
MALRKTVSGLAGVAFRSLRTQSFPAINTPGAFIRAASTPLASSSQQNFGLTHGFAAGNVRGYSTEVSHVMPPTVVALKTPTGSIMYDESVHQRYQPGDPSKKAFTYFVLTGGRFIYASAIRLVVLKFLMSMSASKDVLALANVEVDISNIALGSTVTIKWRGKPVFIRRRTPDEIAKEAQVNVNSLRDPQNDLERAVNPEWLITVGVCTHLGCVPLANAGDYGGWFCPCHGSHYDVSGRIRKGPAPYNLEVPAYQFLEDGKVLIG